MSLIWLEPEKYLLMAALGILSGVQSLWLHCEEGWLKKQPSSKDCVAAQWFSNVVLRWKYIGAWVGASYGSRGCHCDCSVLSNLVVVRECRKKRRSPQPGFLFVFWCGEHFKLCQSLGIARYLGLGRARVWCTADGRNIYWNVNLPRSWMCFWISVEDRPVFDIIDG